MSDALYCPMVLGAPCLKPEVWAAFTQAILSALAIWVSVHLANWQVERRAAEHVLAVTTLVHTLGAHISQYKDQLLSTKSHTPAATDVQFDVILRLREQLNTLVFQQVGHVRTIEPITRINACLDVLMKERALAVCNAEKTKSAMDPSYPLVDYALEVVNSCHTTLDALSRSYSRRGLFRSVSDN